MKVSDEQLKAIANAVNDGYGLVPVNSSSRDERLAAAGRVALRECAKILLAPSMNEERVEASEGPHGTFSDNLLANRLASVLTETDPAIEAVQKEIHRQTVKEAGSALDFAKIVAVIDEARKRNA